jgi:hypothetical protein
LTITDGDWKAFAEALIGGGKYRGVHVKEKGIGRFEVLDAPQLNDLDTFSFPERQQRVQQIGDVLKILFRVGENRYFSFHGRTFP